MKTLNLKRVIRNSETSVVNIRKKLEEIRLFKKSIPHNIAVFLQKPFQFFLQTGVKFILLTPQGAKTTKCLLMNRIQFKSSFVCQLEQNFD